MDESWLAETHPDKAKMKFSGGFGFLFFFFFYDFEYQINVLVPSLICKIFQARSLTAVANVFFISELDFVTPVTIF